MRTSPVTAMDSRRGTNNRNNNCDVVREQTVKLDLRSATIAAAFRTRTASSNGNRNCNWNCGRGQDLQLDLQLTTAATATATATATGTAGCSKKLQLERWTGSAIVTCKGGGNRNYNWNHKLGRTLQLYLRTRAEIETDMQAPRETGAWPSN
jgi:hypothetical protein